MGLDYHDLEISLHKWDIDKSEYAIGLRYSQPDQDVERLIVEKGLILTQFPVQSWPDPILDPVSYGHRLFECLFHPEVRTAFKRASDEAGSQGQPLRVRLFFDFRDALLRNLRWETLMDPLGTLSPLLSDRTWFSRYVISPDWRQVRKSDRNSLRALIAIANPSNISQYRPNGNSLPPIDVTEEFKRIKSALGSMDITLLPTQKRTDEAGYNPLKVTLDNIIRTLKESYQEKPEAIYDIFYLVCHGAVIRGEPRLYLENDLGEVDGVDGEELVKQLRELQQQPRLVVLASCHSAAAGSVGEPAGNPAPYALAPRLVEAGIPAVVAMSGEITVETVNLFMPCFFQAVVQDGQIDRALAVARNKVFLNKRKDWWMPTLFTRLRTGQLWWTPGLHRPLVMDQKFSKWDSLLSSIRAGKCTPILGPGLSEPLLGASCEIARRWAGIHRFPMEAAAQEELRYVAQYMATVQDDVFPGNELILYLRRELWRKYEKILSPELQARYPNVKLNEILKELGKKQRADNFYDPYQMLARLPCPIYISANRDNLLESALQAEGNGKVPRTAICPWYIDAQFPKGGDDSNVDASYEPTIRQPFIYNLFGQFSDPDNLVLTEDHYFDYLIRMERNNDLLPKQVRSAFANTTLLYLGFKLSDWEFRTVFRSISKQEGTRVRRHAHVAVQIDIEQEGILEPELARRYLQKYFENQQIYTFLGDTQTFLKELHKEWVEKYPDEDFLQRIIE